MIRRARFLIAASLVACEAAIGCAGRATTYQSQGEALCNQLFNDETVYLRSPSATDTGVDQLFDRFLDKAHRLPKPPPSFPGPFVALDTAMRSARGGDGEPAGSLMGLIGAARAEGFWRCGNGAADVLRREADAVRLGPKQPDLATYVKEFRTLADAFGAKHEAYHAHPDPVEVRQRLSTGHGPGFIALLREWEAEVEQLGAPPNDAPTVRTLLAFLTESISQHSAGVVAGGERGNMLFESGFPPQAEFAGAACSKLGLFCP